MPKVIINNRVIDRIPLNEFYLEDMEYKGLIFVQHGYMSTKEWGSDYLALPLARLGYFVVCIDSYKHGERIEEPFLSKDEFACMKDVPAVIKWTALDIIKLHKHHYAHFDKFDMIGVSLGGMIAYYLATKTDNVRKLVPVISTPALMNKAVETLKTIGLNPQDFLNESATNFINSIDTINRLEKLKYEELFMLVGKNDTVVPYQDTLDFYEKHQHKDMTLKVYDIDHNVDREMQIDIFTYIEKQKDNQ